jgi:hypothetical protein
VYYRHVLGPGGHTTHYITIYVLIPCILAVDVEGQGDTL